MLQGQYINIRGSKETIGEEHTHNNKNGGTNIDMMRQEWKSGSTRNVILDDTKISKTGVNHQQNTIGTSELIQDTRGSAHGATCIEKRSNGET